MSLIPLFDDIQRAIENIGDGWTTPRKGQIMASMVLTLQPELSVEIGVYAGKGLVSLGLAHKAIGRGMAVGIDPYSAQASIQGQVKPEDKAFWSTVDYERIYNKCQDAIDANGVRPFTRVMRQTSESVASPAEIGVLRIDGNHAEAAFRDAMKFAPRVVVGGFLLLDDVDWAGGHVGRAAHWLRQTGWRELYSLEDGPVFQRVR